MPGKRAVKAEQKEARREEILRAAFALFSESSFEEVSMAAVAHKAGIAKGTVYLYFQTKEEIFLALLTDVFEQTFDGLDQKLLTLPQDCAIELLVQSLGEGLMADPPVLRLTAIMHAIIEKNVTYETILEFKQAMRRRLVYSGGLIEEKLPFLRSGEGTTALITLHAMLVGFQQMTDPTPIAQKVLDTPGMELFKIDLAQSLGEALLCYFKGLEAKASR